MEFNIIRRIINFVYSRDINTVTKRISLYLKDNDMKKDFKLLIKTIPHVAPENINHAWDRLCIIVNSYIKNEYNSLKKENKVIVDILIGIL
jgi:hypothetical protein